MKKSRFSANKLSGYCGKLNSQRKALHGSKVLVLGLACKPNVDDEPACALTGRPLEVPTTGIADYKQVCAKYASSVRAEPVDCFPSVRHR